MTGGSEVGWPFEDEDFNGIGLNAVVGVMHRNHALVGEAGLFSSHSWCSVHTGWEDNMDFDSYNGMVDVVYVEALLPEGQESQPQSA